MLGACLGNNPKKEKEINSFEIEYGWTVECKS